MFWSFFSVIVLKYLFFFFLILFFLTFAVNSTCFCANVYLAISLPLIFCSYQTGDHKHSWPRLLVFLCNNHLRVFWILLLTKEWKSQQLWFPLQRQRNHSRYWRGESRHSGWHTWKRNGNDYHTLYKNTVVFCVPGGFIHRKLFCHLTERLAWRGLFVASLSICQNLEQWWAYTGPFGA